MSAIAEASAALATALRQAAEVRSARLRSRRVALLIDDAIERCERVNLEGSAPGMGPPADLPPPALAVLLIGWLRERRREPDALLATNQQALDELFRLQAAGLRRWQR